MHYIWILWILLSIFSSLDFKTNIKTNQRDEKISIKKDTIIYPTDYFRAPLDLSIILAGSFGEIRNNHFHSGIDIKTNQREGYPVYASADGYISRIRVQAVGYGNALYINHPNGYTTVYGHLQRFNPAIKQTAKSYQYLKESFEIDLPLEQLTLPVKKGDVIGWSGNSGGSAGPHLHFEIRDTQTEETINPQLFGLKVLDHIKPVINGFYVYIMDGKPFSDNTEKQFFKVTGTTGKYRLLSSKIITADTQIGLGIRTYDKNSSSSNYNGVYSIELLMDEKPIFSSIWDRFSFYHSKGVNSHIDFPAFSNTNIIIQKTFVEPGNPLSLYKILESKGLINPSDDTTHHFKFIVKDIAGNSSTLDLKIKFNSKSTIQDQKVSGNLFSYNQINNYSNGTVKVSIPPGVLYSDLAFNYFSTPKAMGMEAYSSVHHIHNSLIPLHSNYTLGIKPDNNLPVELCTKALIVDNKGNAQGGEYQDGYIKASMRNFGSFYIKLDTIAPKIHPINLSEGKSMSGLSKIKLKISDNLSGIRSYVGTIDGKWILMEYDAKTATLIHSFDERTLPGKHVFKLVLTDMKDNNATYTANFYR